MSSEISLKFKGVFCPEMLAEVEVIPLFNFWINFEQNSSLTNLTPILPSSAKTSFATN
jgi:hypothetical protein